MQIKQSETKLQFNFGKIAPTQIVCIRFVRGVVLYVKRTCQHRSHRCLSHSVCSKSCNVPHFSPKGMWIRYFYGFACGDEVTLGDTCAKVNFDTCKYGSKNQLHFSEASSEALNDCDNFMRRILSETISLHLLCLPLNPSTCTDSFNIVDEVTTTILQSSLKEVNNNLNQAKKCNAERVEEIDRDEEIPLCVVDSKGYPILPSSPGRRIYSSDITKQMVGELGGNGKAGFLDDLNKVLETQVKPFLGRGAGRVR